MRSFLISAASVGGLLLLLCALASGPRAAAQSGCTTTYDCRGNSGCISVMGSNITHRSITEYKDQASCDTAARGIMASQPLPTIQCSCGGSGTTTSSDLGGQMGQLISTMTPQQQMGVAAGAVGTLMIMKGLSEMMQPKPVDPAVQQRNLAAQQLNNSGVYLMKQKNYPGAINEFQQALAQTPNDANIKNNLAQAKQAQKNGVIAGQTSGSLGQLLGTAPAGGPEIASNSSPLGMVNLNSLGTNNTGANSTSELRPPGEAPPANQGSLQSQIDGALGNAPAPAPASPAPGNSAQAEAIDQIFNPSQAAAAPPQAQIDAEKNQVDDLFKSPGSTPASAQLVQQASSGEAAANAKTGEEASATARAGFDTAGAGEVTAGAATVPAPSTAVAAAPAPSAAVPPSSAQQAPQAAPPNTADASAPMVVANLKTPAAPAPEYPITPMPERVTSGAAAPGRPIFDCKRDRAVIKRIASGMATQDDAIRRTEAALKAAEEDSADARKDVAFAAVSTLLSSATLATNWAQRGMAEASASSMELDHRKEVLDAMEQVVDYSEKLDKLAGEQESSELKPGESNMSHAADMLSTAKTLAAKMQVAQKFLKDTGLQDDLLEKGATTGATIVAGPLGAAVVETIIHAVDLFASVGQAWNSAGEAAQAEHNLEVMRDEQQRIRSRSYELQQEVVTECANTKTAGY